MKTIVSLDSTIFTNEDISLLNKENFGEEIEYISLVAQGFTSPETILILIELVKNLSYMAIYDTIKQVLSQIFRLISKKESTKTQRFEIICNGTTYTITYDFSLSEEQKSILIETAAKKILEKTSEQNEDQN